MLLDGTQFEAEPGLTSVDILDFELASYLNFEAEVFFPEGEDIKQIEHFGVHVRDDGTVFYGLHLDGVVDRDQHHISLDHLAR